MRDGLRRQADGRRDGHADAGDARRDDVHARRHVAHRRATDSSRCPTSCPANTRCRSARRARCLPTSAAGRWFLRWRPMGPGRRRQPPRSQEPEFATVGVTVGGDDITGLVVVATHGAHATGRNWSSTAATKPEGLASVRVIGAASVDPDGLPMPGIRQCDGEGERHVRDDRPDRAPASSVAERAAEGLVPQERALQRRRRDRHRHRVQAGRRGRRGSRSS